MGLIAGGITNSNGSVVGYKIVSLLYYTSITVIHTWEIIQGVALYTRVLAIILITTFVQMITCLVIFITQKKTIIRHCFQWVSMNPSIAPISPNCEQAALISGWISFLLYLVGISITLFNYKERTAFVFRPLKKPVSDLVNLSNRIGKEELLNDDDTSTVQGNNRFSMSESFDGRFYNGQENWSENGSSQGDRRQSIASNTRRPSIASSCGRPSRMPSSRSIINSRVPNLRQYAGGTDELNARPSNNLALINTPKISDDLNFESHLYTKTDEPIPPVPRLRSDYVLANVASKAAAENLESFIPAHNLGLYEDFKRNQRRPLNRNYSPGKLKSDAENRREAIDLMHIEGYKPVHSGNYPLRHNRIRGSRIDRAPQAESKVTVTKQVSPLRRHSHDGTLERK